MENIKAKVIVYYTYIWTSMFLLSTYRTLWCEVLKKTAKKRIFYMLRGVKIVKDKKNSTNIFYPKSCQVYILSLSETSSGNDYN